MMLRRRRTTEVLATAPVVNRGGGEIARVGDRVEVAPTPLGVRVARGPWEAWVTTEFAAEHLRLRTSGEPVGDAVALLEALLSRAPGPEIRRVMVDLNDRVIEMLDAREAAADTPGVDAA
ncbi:MAG: hypothetical protein ACQEXJ_21650 [Myxococcota bacterium]